MAHANLVPELKPFRDALETAWISQGERLTEDIYSGTVNGLVKCISSIYNGVRSNSSCFVRGKQNVTVLGSTFSKSINFEGSFATSVSVITPGKKEMTFKARKEIIVSSGVFESPKLLMLSGIGPEEILSNHKITPVVKSPHVGQNLLDHPIMPYVRRLKDGYGLDGHLLRAGPMHDGAISAYRKNKSGPLSSGLLELVGFPRIDEYLMKSKEYVAVKKQNGGVDPFGPGGQPHFEIDFVVGYRVYFFYVADEGLT